MFQERNQKKKAHKTEIPSDKYVLLLDQAFGEVANVLLCSHSRTVRREDFLLKTDTDHPSAGTIAAENHSSA